MGKKLHFSVQGEFITKLAREKLFIDHDLGSAIRILRGSLESDEITPDEQLMLCLQILHGAASIKGESGTEEYRVEMRDDIEERPTDLSSIADLITKMDEDRKRWEEKYDDLTEKFGFVCEEIDDWKYDRLNADFYNQTGRPLFPDMPIPDWRKAEYGLGGMSGMLEDYMAQQKREAEKDEDEPTDYGWLEPDGTFHPVEWGQHSEWARDWLKENRPQKEHPDIYIRDGHPAAWGDVLVYSLGWVLLDSPHRGLPKATYDNKRGFTKAQREFLYEYYIDRDMNREANELFAGE